ncbi:hypothetical protein FACS1894151_06760 [Spirochaetia bacterium]|nr:hypothetical protein FACS1894151_06760 [Spirochaetia bacterium]
MAIINGNRDVRYEYGKNGELITVLDNIQRLQVTYRYDNMGREILRTYMNGVTQETQYDQSGRTILIVERDVRREVIRVEGYLYDAQGRRSHSVDEQGRVTKYQYDGQSRLVEVLYPYTETKKNADLQEVAEAGLHVTPSQGQGILYNLGAVELNALRTLLNKTGGNRGSMIASNHVMWKEQYSYDGNGNRLTKTTPWGTVQYQYDRENRLTNRGDIAYSYDRDGNLLTEKGSYREAEYRYNGQHRMVYSAITDVIERTRVSTAYQYDGFGRRTVTQEAGHETMRTLYDAFSFEVVREGITHIGGTFTTQFETGRLTDLNTGTEGSRYRWIGEAQNDSRYRYIGDEASPTRYTGISVTLYGRGEAVAINRNASSGGRGSSAYLGKDILGSVRSSTNEYGIQEDRYEYDAFGKPYEGDFSGGMNLGYTGKPYDAVTGLYNYGYRDYAPVAARFTTVDPIRDGSNWFSYVNNDPVNYTDLWGLSASDYYLAKGNADQSKTTEQPQQNIIIGNREGYNTPDEAARKMLDIVNPISIERNIEYAGRIYQNRNDGMYYASDAIPGTILHSDPLSSPVPEGARVVGDYHTHSDYSFRENSGTIIRTSDPDKDNLYSDEFSIADYTFANNYSKQLQKNGSLGIAEYNSYLGTPSGNYRIHNPFTGLNDIF